MPAALDTASFGQLKEQTLGIIVRRDGRPFPATVLREVDDFGILSYDLVNPPHRFWPDSDSGFQFVENQVDARRVSRIPGPAQLLTNMGIGEGDTRQTQTRRSIARLWAYYLICEDPLRRLDARPVNTLAHQVSLVQHILESDNLRRVLIADEVGLGKTVEAGLLIQQLLEQYPGLRVLYLAPARLVSNVLREFDRLGLNFRRWASGESDARLSDQLIVASIHRAVHGNHFQSIVNTPPWDVLVVDECHHLSDWVPGGGDPREKYRLVRDLINQQRPNSRVILLSGTPHQGHQVRFENLLTLLQDRGESNQSLTGRVIYRTKEDVRDWDGNPVFPPRQVNDPLIVDLGPAYLDWIQHIHNFYRPGLETGSTMTARQRAAGWRCAQALQWATSSPQAGLGYLLRQAIRAGCLATDGPISGAICALRPYRNGPVNEPIETLFQRISREVDRNRTNGDLEDIEDVEVDDNLNYGRALANLLEEGIELVRSAPDVKWEAIRLRLLDPCADEKVVLFAQPIETVMALAGYLERTGGGRPAIIIGGQTDAERDREVQSFWNPDGPRFLVSSKAGGEGINLQIARRLVHIDVPWNPMDLEQRVGRVHRFGSRQTIIVDTVVVPNSREADAYAVARNRLRLIAQTMVSPERFEAVFSRVMGLVPPDELQNVLIHDAVGPLSHQDQEIIGQMMQAGFNSWQQFHERYAEQQQQIRHQDPGLATWDDLARFLDEYGQARYVEGFQALRFTNSCDGIVPIEQPVRVMSFGGPTQYVCGDFGGAPISGPNNARPEQLGLNSHPVAEILRRLAFAENSGAALLRIPGNTVISGVEGSNPFGVLAFVRQTVRSDGRLGYAEVNTSLHCFVIKAGQTPTNVEGREKRQLLVALFSASAPRVEPDSTDPLLADIQRYESDLCHQLRMPSEQERAEGLRHAVTPLVAALVLR